jgi:hypothetical protein
MASLILADSEYRQKGGNVRGDGGQSVAVRVPRSRRRRVLADEQQGLPRQRCRGYAPLALQTGIHPKTVPQRLEHATVSITLDTCSHAIPAMQEEAVLIAGLVFAKGQ